MPSLGEHTVSVLEEAGVDQAVIDKVLQVSTTAQLPNARPCWAGCVLCFHTEGAVVQAYREGAPEGRARL